MTALQESPYVGFITIVGSISRGFPVPDRRLEDKIRALAERAVAAQDPDELKDALKELRAALREHAERLRRLAAEKLAPSATRPRNRDYDQ